MAADSTFPLDRSRIRKEKWKAALGSPITWAPLLPAVGAFVFLGLPWWGLGLALFAIGGGLAYYWRGEGKKIEARLIREMIAESNDAQDRELAQSLLALREGGHEVHAEKLLVVLGRKRLIEEELHRDGAELTPQKEEVEQLIDTLAFGVRDQLNKLVTMEAELARPVYQTDDTASANLIARIEEGREQINRATQTIDDTLRNLNTILNPVGDTTHLGAAPELDRVIERLQEESAIAKRVRERLSGSAAESDEAESSYEDPPRQLESE